MSALDDRRQIAREAYWDADGADRAASCDAAIETATRVQISEDIIAAAGEFAAAPGSTKGVYRMLATAFRAAGFEVVE